MRTTFGRFSQELRLARGMNQKKFSEISGMSMSHISNLEHGRMNIGDDIVGAYVHTLDCSGEESHELRKRAEFANRLRRQPEPESPLSPIKAMFEQFGDRLSPDGRAEIQRILERETGEKIEVLTFSSNKGTKRPRKKKNDRPSLTPAGLVEIALIAEEVRSRVCGANERVELGYALEKLCQTESRLDYDVRKKLPQVLDGAFAGILGHADGHTIMVEEDRFLSAIGGTYFGRHAIAHELGHHFLHPHLLKSQSELWLPPQELSKNSPKSWSSDDGRIEQVVETIEEVEAECFATLFLVPWGAFFKGTKDCYLSQDFGEQPTEVARYARFFRLKSVRDEFRVRLWDLGRRKEPVFDID